MIPLNVPEPVREGPTEGSSDINSNLRSVTLKAFTILHGVVLQGPDAAIGPE